MLKCPFCGKNEPEVLRGPPMGGYGDEPYVFRVRCSYCGATGPESSTEAKAIEEWEERHGI